MDSATAIMLAVADANIVTERASLLIHRIAFLRSWKRQTGVLGDVGQLSLDSARRELHELLRNGPSPATLTQ